METDIAKIETTELSDNSRKIIEDLKKLDRAELGALIDELEQGKFDDFHVNAYPLPRMELINRLSVLGLHDMAKRIIHGAYDD